MPTMETTQKTYEQYRAEYKENMAQIDKNLKAIHRNIQIFKAAFVAGIVSIIVDLVIGFVPSVHSIFTGNVGLTLTVVYFFGITGWLISYFFFFRKR